MILATQKTIGKLLDIPNHCRHDKIPTQCQDNNPCVYVTAFDCITFVATNYLNTFIFIAWFNKAPQQSLIDTACT